jgi:hypothetical protein
VSEFHVGQELYLQYHERRFTQNRPVFVSKVGRKWIHFDDGRYRFNPESMRVDGGGYSSPGTVYMSKEEHDAEMDKRDAWDRFRLNLPSTPPAHLTG